MSYCKAVFTKKSITFAGKIRPQAGVPGEGPVTVNELSFPPVSHHMHGECETGLLVETKATACLNFEVSTPSPCLSPQYTLGEPFPHRDDGSRVSIQGKCHTPTKLDRVSR